jgi:hypothetical protein
VETIDREESNKANNDEFLVIVLSERGVSTFKLSGISVRVIEVDKRRGKIKLYSSDSLRSNGKESKRY